MSTLAEIVKHVMIIIVITSFLELMLPEGGIKPFVRFAIGLFVIIAVLNPVLGYLFQDHNFEIKWWDVKEQVSSQGEVEQKGRELKEQITSAGSNSLKQKLEGQINSLAQLVPGVAEVESRVELDRDGAIKALSLSVKEEVTESEQEEATPALTDKKAEDKSREQIKNKLTSLLQNFYGLEGVKVEFIFEGG
ncbi:MAG: stage III sporulation protein AF [Syntrophomonadaceae bacterium]